MANLPPMPLGMTTRGLPLRNELDGESAVTPVVGTLLVLSITIIGMVGIMAWGAPTIESIQAQNAQVAMVGEFEDLRASSIELSIPDASRIPIINLPRGTLGIERGTRLMVTANHYNAACDLHVTGWNDATPTSVDVQLTGCNDGNDQLEILQVVGSNTISKHSVAAAGGAVTVAGVDFTTGSWLFRITDGTAPGAAVRAQAWLFETERVAWSLPTSSGTVGAFFELGAVFSDDAGAVYLEKAPSLQENEFGANVYALRVRTLSNPGGTTTVSGQGSFQVFLGLVGNHVRVDAATYSVRYDFAGDYAESWCGALKLRNSGLADLDANGVPDAAYADQPGYTCQAPSNAEAIRSVRYANGSAAPFAFEVIHATMRVTLSV